jgi:hypothetical protein
MRRAAMRRAQQFLTGAAARQFWMGVAAGLTAMGITGLLRWLREPALRGRRD